MQQFQQAIDADPKNADADYNLASTYHQLGKLHHRETDLSQAEINYHRCLDNSPNHEDCYRGLAVLLVDRGIPTRPGNCLVRSQRRARHARPEDRVGPAGRRTRRPPDGPGQADRGRGDRSAQRPGAAALGKVREESGDSAQALANHQRSLQINRFQPDVAARVAALQPASNGAIVTPPGGTRTVNANAVAPSIPTRHAPARPRFSRGCRSRSEPWLSLLPPLPALLDWGPVPAPPLG